MKQILIAEDSSVILNLVKKVISQATNNVGFTTVKNGELLINQLDTTEADLFLIDLNIPKVDGIACLKAIRSHAKHADKPVIAITGNAMNYTAEDFKNYGFNDFLIKPLNFDALVFKVKSFGI